MARGYPDFFSMPIFPTRGIFRGASDDILCPAGATTTVVSLGVKANLVALAVNYLCLSSHRDDIINVTLDGGTLVSLTVENLLLFGNSVDLNPIVRLVCLDEKEHNYAFSFNPGLDWGASFEVSMENVEANNALAVYQLAYYEVV